MTPDLLLPRPPRAAAALLSACLFACLPGAGVQAATIQVESTYNSDTGCTLRDAITAANADINVDDCERIGGGTADTIVLPPLYIPGNAGTASPDYDDEDANARGDYDITSAVTIQGVSATRSSIGASPLDRLFDVRSGGSLTLRDVTLFGGSVIASNNNNGGTLYKSSGATLALERVLVFGGSAARGGAIFAGMQGGTLTISDSTIRNGYAVMLGGGLSISAGASPALTTLTNTTISGNTAERDSAISLNGATLLVRNSTIARNQTLGTSFSAVQLDNVGGNDIRFINTLIVENSNPANFAANLRCGIGADVGLVKNSIIVGSTGCTVASTVGTPPGGDARLMPLFDYGGGIPTHALAAGSDAIGTASPPGATGCPGVDARGVGRTASCDIGAFEAAIDITVNSFADLPDLNPGDGLCRASGNACTLRAATMEAGASGGRWVVGLPPGTYTLSQAHVFNDDPAGGDLDIEAASTEVPPLTFFLLGLGTPADTHIVGSQHDRVLQARGTWRIDDDWEDRWLSFAMSNITVRGGHLSEDAFRSEYENLGGAGVMLSAGNSLLYNVVVRDNELRPTQGHGLGGGVGIWVPRYAFNQHPQAQSARMERFAVIDNIAASPLFDAPEPKIASAGGIFVSAPDLMEYNDDAVALVNGTIAGNRADSMGGIYITQKSYLSFLTITQNVSRAHDDEFWARSGGIMVSSNENRMNNSIIAGNLFGTLVRDCGVNSGVSTALNSVGHLLIGNATGCNVGGDTASNLLDVDPLLGPREIAPGGMVFHRVAAASPALRALTLAACTDDRGFGVMRDAKGDVRPLAPAGQCTIGAAEGIAPQVDVFADGFE